MSTILKYIFFGIVDSNFYFRNQIQLNERNYATLKTAYLFSTGMCTFLFVLTYLVNLIGNLTLFYGFYVVWFCLCSLFVITIVKKHKKFCKVMFYIFAASILYLCAYIGAVNSKDMYAVTFFVFIIFIPSLYVDRPINSILITVIASLIFCIMVLINKTDPRLIQNDLLNALCVAIVSLGYGVYTTNVNLENIQATLILKEQSNIDELTLLPNRRWFNKSIAEIYEKSSNKGLNIYMIDIDFFKKYNDTYGHLKGDECLAKIGKELNRIAKKLNVFVSRYGGEEFIVVDDRHTIDESKEIAESIVREIKALRIRHETSDTGFITVSVGYASRQGNESSSYIKLINYADEALYKAKNMGRDRAVAYNFKKN